MAGPWRIVFMGTPEFAVGSFTACLEVGQVVAVVTQPDKPRGRGQEVQASPVKSAALQRGIPVLQPAKLRGTGFSAELSALAPDVCVVTAYGKILPPDLLAVPRFGCVNVHASLLPRFRGAAPIQWAIASGDKRTGVCLMVMDAGMDTGPVLARAELPVAPDETFQSLHDRLAKAGHDLLRDELPRYLRGELSPVAQSAEGVVAAPMIRKEDGRLDFGRPAKELERRVRAFTPWPGMFTSFAGARVKVREAREGDGHGAPGTVLAAGPEGLEVACQEGSLVLTALQPEGKRSMSAAEFLAGRKIAVGSRPFET